MLKNNDIRKFAVIAAVIVLPLVYSFFYLYAFWDPYSKLQELPVAVVNEDKGAAINGVLRNIGEEITDELKTDNNLKWVVTNRIDAESGIRNRKYYAEIVIPENFSTNISTADKTQKNEGIIIYQPQEKRNFLAAQVLSRVMLEFKDKISHRVTEEIVSNMVTDIRKVPDELNELSKGLDKLHDGSETLYDGANELKSGQIKFKNGAAKLNSGMTDAYEGLVKLESGSAAMTAGSKEFSTKLNSGVAQIVELQQGSKAFAAGMQQVSTGASVLLQGIDTIKNGSGELHTGLAQYSKSMDQFSAGVEMYIDSVKKSGDVNQTVSTLLTAYIKEHPEAMKDANIQKIIGIAKESQSGLEQLSTASDAIKASASALNEGAKKLEQGSSKLDNGAKTLADKSLQMFNGVNQLASSYNKIDGGIKQIAVSLNTAAESSAALHKGMLQLNQGVESLGAGLTKLKAGSKELYVNSNRLMEGQQKLSDGVLEIKNGIGEVKDGVTTAVQEANNKLKAVDGIDKYASEPVKLEEHEIDKVPDYGTAFTPYFMSLSMWVGAIIIFIAIYLDPRIKLRKSISKRFNVDFKFLSYSLIGIVQALVLTMIMKNTLNLTVKNTALFYLVSILISLTFISIVQFLMVNLKDVGKFLSLILLILQLTACGGTFPMELVPRFFNVINPFMPMTYSVNALKEVISGVDYGYLGRNAAILAITAIVFLVATLWLSGRTADSQNEYEEHSTNVKEITA